MAIFRIQVFKTLTGDRFWTNVYHVDATDIDAAAAFANTGIAPAEASLMDGSFKVVKTIVSSPSSDDFVTTPLSITGGLAGSPYLPLFNTVKVNVAVEGHGRPDYKFYRGGVTEGNQTNAQLDSATVDAYTDMVNDLVDLGASSSTPLTDAEGNLWGLAQAATPVQMRQLHRKRKKVPSSPPS